MPTGLKSRVERMGKLVTQIIHFTNGNKRTFNNIRSDTIIQGEFTKMITTDGRMIMVNTKNVDVIEVFPQKKIH